MDSTREKYKLHKAIEARMSGPVPSPTPTPVPTPTPSPSPSGKFKCVSNQCVSSSSGGVSKDICEAICVPSKYKCKNNQCVADADGVDQSTCEAICGGSSVV